MAESSIHFEPVVKGSSEEHNKRLKFLDYVHPERTHLNEYWESDNQANRLDVITKNFLEHHPKRKKLHVKATPIREAVVNIEEGTTMEDLKELAKRLRDRFGIEVFQIAIHKDEGYKNSNDPIKLNLHAHLVADWTDHSIGESLKLKKQDMAEMQTITAEVLGMKRGVSSDKKHLSAMQYKEKKAREEAEKAIQAKEKAAVEAQKWQQKATEAQKAATDARSKQKAAEAAAIGGFIVGGANKLANKWGFGKEAKQLKELPQQLAAAKEEGRTKGKEEAIAEVLKGAGLKCNDLSKITAEKVGKDLMNIVHKKAEAAQEDTKKLKIIQNMAEQNYTYDAAAKLIKDKYPNLQYSKESFGYVGSEDGIDFKSKVFDNLCESEGAHNVSNNESAIGRREGVAQGLVCACIRFFDSAKLDRIAKSLKVMAQNFNLREWRQEREQEAMQNRHQEQKNQEQTQGRGWGSLRR